MVDSIRVIQYGLGPIGCAVARQLAQRQGLALVGGVEIDPAKVGKDLGETIGLDRPLGVTVAESLEKALAQAEADLVVHTTSSHFSAFQPQIIEILEAGLDVVSTAEELSFPWLAHPEEAAEIDAVAKRVGKTVLGTGVNPGFLMDALPLYLTTLCQQVDRIEVIRAINASTRRGPFQKKIGSGMTVETFNAKMASGKMGHVGLPESVGMIVQTVGKHLVRTESSVEPVIAEHAIKTDAVDVEPGQVRGLKQVVRAYTDEGEFMTLTFLAALELEDEKDTIKIAGKPDLEVTLQGTNGDIATVAIVINAIRPVKEARPGLLTMPDLPLITLS